MLDEKLQDLKAELIEYARFIEKMLEKSIKGLMEKDRNLLIKIINEDEPRANNMEIQIDEYCTHLIAQYEPKASKLRIILMILKMNNDLERIGDHAVNISESSLFLIERPLVKPLIDIPRMADITMRMIKESISSFINNDTQLARSVSLMDNMVNELRDQILRELITFMSADPKTIERSIQLLRIASNLERVGDLTTNICEDVIYAFEGKIIKHHYENGNN